MEKILQAIEKFIDHRMYHYALLINGKWGCGKTYFIKEKLIPYLENKKYSDEKPYGASFIRSRNRDVESKEGRGGVSGSLIS